MAYAGATGACHTFLALGHIGSVVDRNDPEVPIGDPSQKATPREADAGSAEDQEVEGVNQQDGSSSSPAVEHLCPRRTWKSLAFRLPSEWGIVDKRTESCGCRRKESKYLVEGTKEIILRRVVLLRPTWWQRTSIYRG